MQVNAPIKWKQRLRGCVCRSVYLLVKTYSNTIRSMATNSTSIRWLNCCAFSLTTLRMLGTIGCKSPASETMKS